MVKYCLESTNNYEFQTTKLARAMINKPMSDTCRIPIGLRLNDVGLNQLDIA